jgi:acyl-CoA synthetase (AMP-forming)/AMP-acid ligase II
MRELSAAVGLIAKNSVDYVRRFFDHLSEGVVVVPLRSSDDNYRIRACGLTRIVEPLDIHGWCRDRFVPTDSDAVAQVAFTSGTEGEPKAVLLTHRNLADPIKRLQSVMKLDATVREYVGVPVYHSFGFGRCRAVAAAGGSFYVPPGGFDLRELAEMIDAGEVNSVSAVPSLWRLVLRNKALFSRHPERVRWIEIGSQAMSAKEKLALRELFPQARIVQHYGLTEASRTALLDVPAASPEALESVGQAIGEVEVEITGEGRIRTRGPHVARERLEGGRRVPNIDAQGWFVTNDRGDVRDGRLHFLGRVDDLINIAGVKIYPDAIEAGMRTALGVEGGFCVVRVADSLRGESILVAALRELPISDEHLAATAGECLARAGVEARSSVMVTRLGALPATESGKIKRSVVAQQFQDLRRQEQAAEASALQTQERRAHGQPRTAREVFQQVFPDRLVTDADTFVSLGGDSLSYVEATLALEELVGKLPDDWQNISVAEFDALPRQRTGLVNADTALALRFLGILAVVASHFELFDLGGATFLLIVVAGFNFARFQLPNVLRLESIRPVLASIVPIALPALIAITLLEIKTGHYDGLQLMLLGNWEDATTQWFSLWFLEMLVQVYLIAGALLLIPAVQHGARRHAWRTSSALLALSAAMAIATPLIWDVEQLAIRIPPLLLWLFFLGWSIQQARGITEKALTWAGVVGLPLLIWVDVSDFRWLQHGIAWVVTGGTLLLFLTAVKLPRPVFRVVSVIAEASMFIYIVHWSARANWVRVSGVDSPALNVAIGVAGGVGAYWLWRWLSRRMGEALQPQPADDGSSTGPLR